MSRKTPQFREKIFWKKQNILVWAAKPGENSPRKKNVPENATKPGQTATPEKNVPKNGKGATNDVTPYYISGISPVIFS